MYRSILFVLFFPCCFAQEEIFDQDDNLIPGEEIIDLSSEENPSSEDRNSVGEILRELGAELNKDLRLAISDILVDMVDMKSKVEEMADTKVKMEQMQKWLMTDLQQGISEIQADILELKEQMIDTVDLKKKILKNEERIAENSDTIYDVNSTISNVKSIVEKNSAQISSVSEEVKQQKTKIESLTSSAQKQENMMVNNIQRLNSMDTKIADLKVNMVRNEGKIVKNNEMISDVKSSLSEVLEQQQIYTESMDKMASQPSVINTVTIKTKTSKGKWSGCDSCLSIEINTPQGSCRTNNIPGILEADSTRNVTGSVLGSCESLHTDTVTSVVFHHNGGDAWKGDHITIKLSEEKIFFCPGGYLKESENRKQLLSTCTEQLKLEAVTIKTSENKWSGCVRCLSIEINTPQGSCRTNTIPAFLEVDSTQIVAGSVLGSCESLHTHTVTSVVLHHKGTDVWIGDYITIKLSEEKIFFCPGGFYLKESDNKKQLLSTCTEQFK